MAYNQIPVDASKFWGQRLLRVRGLLLEARDALREVEGKMQACVDGSDYTQLEEQFGIETGKGQTALGETSSVLGKLDSTGGDIGNVQAAIDQFIDYIG